MYSEKFYRLHQHLRCAHHRSTIGPVKDPEDALIFRIHIFDPNLLVENILSILKLEFYGIRLIFLWDTYPQFYQ